MQKYPNLFRPGYIGRKRIKNRLIMSPMVSGLAVDGQVTDSLLEHYEARARGGVGMIIVEAACIDAPIGREGFAQLALDNPKYIPGLYRLSETIKMHGAAAFIQLLHIGREVTPFVIDGNQPVAPSEIPCKIIRSVPRALTTEEVKELVQKFADSAYYASRAGFDGVELHAAHGYLLNEFLSPNANHRTDEYGGSLENRERFLLECVQAIKKQVPDLLLSVRLNMDDFIEGGLTLEESVLIGQHLETAGVDVIHCSCGTYESGLKSIEPASYEEGWRVYMAEALKKEVRIPVITGGMVRKPEMADTIIREGKADFVFMARGLLADPQWPQKAFSGREEDIRPCLNCDVCISNISAGKTIACTVNPFAGREGRKIFFFSGKGRMAAVVGGGIAGMQAALTLDEAGYQVILYERQSALGGMMIPAAAPPLKHRIELLRQYLIRRVEKSAITLRLQTSFGEEDLKTNAWDRVVLATGSVPMKLPIPGADLPLCVDSISVLQEGKTWQGKRVVVIGGGSTGLETAHYLQEHGDNRISIVEMRPYLAMDMEKKNRRDLLNHLKPFDKYVSARVEEILADGVRLVNAEGEQHMLPADYVVMAVGFKPEQSLYEVCVQWAPRVDMIGDAYSVRSLREAMLEASMLTR